jgi:hypothetical protein
MYVNAAFMYVNDSRMDVNDSRMDVNESRMYVNEWRAYVNGARMYVNDSFVYVNGARMYVNAARMHVNGSIMGVNVMSSGPTRESEEARGRHHKASKFSSSRLLGLLHSPSSFLSLPPAARVVVDKFSDLGIEVDNLARVTFWPMLSKVAELRYDHEAARSETLERVGIRYNDAVRLGREHRLWRIKQAIKQWCVARINNRKPIGVGWLVQCLDQYWLPFAFFEHAPSMDRRSKERRWALSLNLNPEGRDYIEKVEAAVLPLTFWEWEFLARKAVRNATYDTHRRELCENPTQTNWNLCEGVYSGWKRGALAADDYKQNLEKLKRLGLNLSRPQLTPGPQRKRMPFNLRHNPSVEQLRWLLLDLDDDDGPHVAWVGWDGELHIDPVPDDYTTAWFTKSKERQIRFVVGTYGLGTGYVGPRAAADDRWVRELYYNVMDYRDTEI